jgi:hypothetical protein
VDVLGVVELEFRIALLPPILRGSPFGGPVLYARQLVELWGSPDGEVPLAEAFRLLDVDAVAGVILRATTEYDQGDLRYWHFPPFADLLPQLRAQAWQEILAGKLVLEGLKGLTGRRHHALAPALLPRLTPDWDLSRLTRDGRDEYTDVRVRRPAAEPVKATWRERIPEKALENAMQDIARTYEGRPRPRFKDVLKEMRDRLGSDLPRDVVRNALTDYAPQLKRAPGQR